jgi:FtsP/CotA-like multicopper oxidase with cupredoxin domain
MRRPQRKLSRRGFIGAGTAAVASIPVLHETVPHQDVHAQLASAKEPGGRGAPGDKSASHAGSANSGMVGTVDPAVNGFDPQAIVRDFDGGAVTREGGRTVRTFEIAAEDKEIEVGPGVKFDAWTYNGRVPGPTLRATEGDLVRVKFVNGSKHPHTIHFHGIHPARMDGVPQVAPGNIEPGRSFTYEFEAEPFGLHLYHCHTSPLADHIAKGLYGAFIIDPKDTREKADELVMVMHGFDTNFDRTNEIYAVNGPAFAYHDEPIKVKRGELVRMYIVNILEFDLLNSFHLHANFFD